jgi:transposase
MISLTAKHTFYLYRGVTDMRKGINGLCGIINNECDKNIMSGDIFIFVNKSRDQIRLLSWEIDGFGMYIKRLEKGRFELPKNDETSVDYKTINFILQGIKLQSIKSHKRYVQAV